MYKIRGLKMIYKLIEEDQTRLHVLDRNSTSINNELKLLIKILKFLKILK